MSEMSIKKAAMISFSTRYTVIFIQIFHGAILARILTPEDFGIVAITTVFTTFFMLIADMGLGTAVIQNKTLNDEDTNNIFSFSFYLAIIVAIIFALFSIPLSIFYGNEVYKLIGFVLSISLFFSTMNMIPNAMLLKNKEFKTVGMRLITVSLSSSIITIILALLGFKYYAIILHSLITAFFMFIWNYKSVNLKFKLQFDKNSILKIKQFFSFQFAFSIVNYFSRNLDNLLIGKFMGTAALAFYDKGYRLMLYPVGNLTHVITPVLHPILSEHQDDKEYIFTKYMKVVKILSLLGAFITAYCFFAAEEIVLIMFGDQWISTVPCFRFLALSVWAQMITSSTGSIFQSLGNTRLMFITGICTSLVSVTAIIVGISFRDITIMAACVAVAYNLHFFIAYYILIKHVFEYKYRDFLKHMIPDVAVFLITIAGLFTASFYKIDGILLSALYKGVAGGGAYILGLLLTKQYKVFSILIKGKDKKEKQ